MKIGIASDHGGFELKEKIKEKFPEYEWEDFGCETHESVDYPPFIQALCRAIRAEDIPNGIALCGTGIGAAITANRFEGIRAALVHNEFTAEMSRRHNDANVLVLGGRVLEEEMAFKLIEIYLQTGFEGGRHERRIQAIDKQD